jgi:NADPH:quinone reductase-like Zn-dependent oxidoreductase
MDALCPIMFQGVTTVRAITFSRFGGPEVLEVREVPEREPAPGQVRIRVAAATVNPTDIGFRSGRQAAQLGGLQPPYIPGMEMSGVVDAVGQGSQWQVGDRVMAIVVPRRPEGGAMAGSVVVPSASAAPIPKGASFEAAATLPMNGLTVRMALDLLALKPGDTLAITGAAGAVGGYAIELGVAEGLRVIAVAAEKDEPLLRQLGAEAVVPRGDDAAQRIRSLIPDGVDGLIDAALIGAPILPAIRDGGGLAAVREFEGETERGITIHRVGVTGYAENQRALEQLGRLVEEGKLTLRVAETFPPERVAEAHRKLAAGGVRGRLVIVFSQPEQ